MELKDFQQRVLDTLDSYLDELTASHASFVKIAQLKAADPDLDLDLPDFTEKAWGKLRDAAKLPPVRAKIPYSHRIDGIGRPVPSIAFKVPTGGGKTWLATNAVSRIMSKWQRRNSGFVLWIVPNESIYTQTKKALTNREHPYRQQLDKAAAGRVKIMEKNDPLNKRDVESHLCVMLLMLQSANRETQETLRIFRDRGNVHGFFPVGDDYLAHHQELLKVPNLDVYGERDTMGAIVKDSLGNVLRSIQPIVVLDEGHKGYSKLALTTLYGFNPSFVLELSATPKDRPKDTPPMYSNWLVDVRGTELDREGMIKLPLNVTVHGGEEWRDCLRESLERLNELQREAERLQSDTGRYIRPIALIQVERTGKDQRESGLIHAADVREYLLALGVSEKEIAEKTAEKNDLKDPENIDLLSPTCQVRFIITKQALQEGWDCPFAYVLCALAATTNKSALTQLVGRILRQPDTIKTGSDALDECYVICHHASTREVIDAVKAGLEQDGMADLADQIREHSGDGGRRPEPRQVPRRGEFRTAKIFLPLVNRVEGATVRPLDYERDILQRLPWERLTPDSAFAERVKKITTTASARTVKITLKDDVTDKDFITRTEVEVRPELEAFDPVYVVRSIVDIVPNPWRARQIVAEAVALLWASGLDDDALGQRQTHIIEELRKTLLAMRDKLAEEVFTSDVAAGTIQFRLRTDGHNWRMPDTIPTDRAVNSQELRRDDGEFVKNSLFAPAYRDDFNDYEQQVACYLDSEATVQWWHRNVAKRQYGIQGWRKPKIYPDFIFCLSAEGGIERLMVVETKGDHLEGNNDTNYKKKLLELCSGSFQWENVTRVGELELVYNPQTSVNCALVYQKDWKSELGGIVGRS
ncbi:DEAD/DEAH box helicase [Geobacter sulfurreducens]|uniref:DEAD/DEAH box helicase n=1 Tax=Geobacter sulfurreducens TaxID=35554 RepID=UPI0020B810B1|nr:DEAD/DEAH box helicase family protein [Geobacter sulfurreducens]UTG93171.1 DEAD/DEAH box helicase family protein [Geobacter sulfurreducens]